MKDGTIIRVTGPVVTAEGLERAKMFDVVRVGELGLVGEVIKLQGTTAILQIYEDTTGVRPGDKVVNTGQALSVELGPGLLTSIYDGIQRPLNVLREQSGDFISRGLVIPALDEKKKWEFVPSKKKGDKVAPGEIIGTVQETQLVSHKIMVPPGVSGELKELKEGKFTIREVVGKIKTSTEDVDVFLATKWKVRTPRPIARKLPPDTPLLTGQRVFDTFFPVAKGGTAAIPGPFGSGKTVSQQQLAKWSDSRIIVYVGCGERGNEMTEVLATFPELEDPRSKRPLMERTILVANTSNMPVAAREASIYTGITLAEYYRDMGYDVALMADSTSRWAEALREISGRLEEMPGEEGYPAYLGSRLAEFYERSGKVIALGPDSRVGSVTVVGAVSPPGGDFSEPVSQNTLRVTRVFWALDASLASRRHFPAINWLTSYSLYTDDLKGWYQETVAKEWPDMRAEALGILQKEAELNDIVQLVGYDALPESEKGAMDVAKSIREDYLQQSAYDAVDTYTSMKKQYLMLNTILAFGREEADAIRAGAQASQVSSLPVKVKIGRIKWTPEDQVDDFVKGVMTEMDQQFGALVQEVKV
ncbi:MAG: V-type ATP synthase subunit A [Nitrososphaerota archaeon]|jgi:V/A-type H+-transporting ATPase subunit A|nr:V-type ATP synthase subunit A [Nitrososphaerota archaeon]MCL5672096.1 V-type ATP synthase subunit A [Nitrososphaerota archaeon]MDG6903624.1 V-type ATP synthase subunit A [Nitrososphaerota archaeon]MDG6911920.1 V-type ATP synthase subunit A [Nitrososphaerota archaeon]MDG6924473.1 V-type ATP synthase subunit A [Nitrososphaerota archaeon]